MGDIHNEFTRLVDQFMKQLEDIRPSLSLIKIYDHMETMQDHLFGGEEILADFPPELNNMTDELKKIVDEHPDENEEFILIFIDKMNEIVDENRPVRAQVGGRRRTHHRRRRVSHRRRSTFHRRTRVRRHRRR